MTSRAIGAWALGAVLLTALPAQAQRRELQQMAADLRILQEQTQLLQNAVTALNESLKSVNARIDEQATVTRKGFADNKLVVDGMGSDIRVVRERVDDTNVRITSLSQEVEALRLAIPPMPVYSPPTDTAPGGVPGDPSSPAAPAAPPSNPTGAPAPAASAPTPAAPAPGSPTRLYDMAWADYTAGSYDLAIEGFSSYVRSFPKSESADNAQYYIGASYFQRGRWPEAVDAFNRVITTYPKGDVANQAYYQRGLSYERMNQTDQARQSYEFVIKNAPDTDAGRLAKQRLDSLNRVRPQ
jgi:tol-pal system protein YbgF